MIICGQGKLFVFLRADIQGQLKMTSLKEEMPEACGKPEAKAKNKVSPRW